MLLIQQVTTNPLQKQVLVLPDGSQLSLTINFVPMQFGWFVTEMIYGTFVLHGLRISNSPNMLNQFRNQIPFGFACFSSANREPTQQEDFSSGNSLLYILTQDEVDQYARFLQLG